MRNGFKKIAAVFAAAAILAVSAGTAYAENVVVGVGPGGQSAGTQQTQTQQAQTQQTSAPEQTASGSAGPGVSAQPAAQTAAQTAQTAAQTAQTAAQPGQAASEVQQPAAAGGADLNLGATFMMFFHGTGWGSWSPDNQRVYRTSTYPTAFRGGIAGSQPSNVTGTLQYQVSLPGAGWGAVCENGAAAGDETGAAAIDGIRVWVNGDLSNIYDVYTMAMVGGKWQDWVVNGQDAGVPGTGSHIDGVRISLVKKGQQPAEVTETVSYSGAALGNVDMSRIDPSRPMIALTFDDGPSNYDNRILTALERVGGRATFFMVGNLVNSHQDVVRRMMADGMEIGNHSWAHENLAKLSYDGVQNSVSKANNAIAGVTGHNATVMRPPYGSTGGSVKSALAGMGYASVLWSIDTLDWKTRNADNTVNVVLSQVKDGDIILMHSIYDATATAVERLVPELAARGFQLVTVSELAAARGGMTPGVNYGKFRP